MAQNEEVFYMSMEYFNTDQIDLFIKYEQLELIDKESLEMMCSRCRNYIFFKEWKINRIPLDEHLYGENASHIRLECPNCGALYDHRDKNEINFEVRESSLTQDG